MNTLPPEIAALLTGRPGQLEWEPVFPLVTVDEDGFPRACMLSTSELRWGGCDLRAVLRGRRARRDLRRHGQALLIVVGECHVHSLRLMVAADRESDQGADVVRFRVTAVTSDGVGVPLTATKFLRTAALDAREQVDVNAVLLHGDDV